MNRMVTWVRPVLVAVVLPLPLCAYELVVRDVGVSLDYAPADFDYQLSGGGISRSGSDGFDSGIGLSLRGLYSFTSAGQRHGPVVEFGGGFSQQTYSPGGGMTLLGIQGGAGYGFAIIDRWDVHGLLRLGFGVTTLDIDASATAPSFSADGAYLSYGLITGVSYLMTERWALRAELGYTLMSTALDGNGGTEVELDLTAPSISFGVYWRVTSMPWRLE